MSASDLFAVLIGLVVTATISCVLGFWLGLGWRHR